MFETLKLLNKKGVRFSTIVDVGCADGHFFLTLHQLGIAGVALPLNIDPNETYKDSLQSIRDVIGGHYRICALSDRRGELELTMSTHPYWSSLRPPGDSYWQRINDMHVGKKLVPATTLDALVEELQLPAPFLLKLDVQGAESSVLRGAARTLRDTHVVVCEADLEDFHTIDSTLLEHCFVLYDLTQLNRVGDGTLGWFYPIYINRAIDHVRPKNVWEPSENQEAIQIQEKRRKEILQKIAEYLAYVKNQKNQMQGRPETQQTPAAEQAHISRNQPCPCGSGKKFKHCCGAYTSSANA